MSIRDFKAKQLRTTNIIGSGSNVGTEPSILIYSASAATDSVGSRHSDLLTNVGTDVFLFVSGSKTTDSDGNIAYSNNSANRVDTAVFGGDLVVSGVLYAEVLRAEVDMATTGSLSVEGPLMVTGSAEIGNTSGIGASVRGKLTVANVAGDEPDNALTVYNNDTDSTAIQVVTYATTGKGQKINAAALTTGTGLEVLAGSNTFSGKVAEIDYDGTSTNAHTVLLVSKDDANGSDSNAIVGLDIDFNMTDGTAGRALRIDSEQTTGIVAEIDSENLTSGKALAIENLDALTSGNAVSVRSDSSNQSGNLVSVTRGPAGGSGGTAANNVLSLANLSTNGSDTNQIAILHIDNNMTSGQAGRSIMVDSEQTTGVVAEVDGNQITTGAVLVVSGNSITTGEVFKAVGQSEETLISLGQTAGQINLPQAVFLSSSAVPNLDVSFFVSGSTGDRGLNKGGISLFAGDVVISGSLTDGEGNPIAGGGTGTVTSGSFNEVSVTGEVNSFVTTASVSFAGASGFQHDVHEVGTDVYFFVSGTTGEGVSGATGGKKAVFGGDTFTSGSISGIKGFRIGTEYKATAPVQNTTGAIVSSNGLDSSLELISVANPGANGGYFGESGIYGYKFVFNGTPGGDNGYFRLVGGNQTNQHEKLKIALDSDRFYIHSGTTTTGNSKDEWLYKDTNFFSSGAIGSRGTSERGTALFGGDVAISGSLFVGHLEADDQEEPVLVVDYENRRVGIGTSSPTGGLEVLRSDSTLYDAGSDYTTGDSQIIISNNFGTAKTSAGIIFGNGSDSATAGLLSTIDPEVSSGADVVKVILDAHRNDGVVIRGKRGTRSHNQVLILSGGSGNSFNEAAAADVAFYVSGSIGSKGTSQRGTSVFGGDVVISGTLKPTAISGSLTHLQDGTSYLIAGSNVTITTGSNGAVTIASTATGGGSGAGSEGWIAPTNQVISTTGSLRIGTADENNPDIDLGSDGSAVFNEQGASVDFRVESDNKTHAIFVDGSTDQVLILSGGAESSLHATNFADTNFFVSGAIGSRGTASRGTSVFGGDTVVSGALYVGTSDNDYLYVQKRIVHTEDTDTYLSLVTDGIYQVAGNNVVSLAQGSSGNESFQVNPLAQDIDFIAQGDTTGKTLINAIAQSGEEQVLILSGGAGASFDESSSGDVAFYVSGTIGSRGTSNKGTAVFGGDLVMSGATHALSVINAPAGLSGSITQLSDGTSFIKAGSNVTITSASNGAITIASTAIGGGGGAGSEGWIAPANNFIVTTGSLLIGTADQNNPDINLSSDGAAVFNEQGAAVDFRVESDNKTHAIFVDGSTDQVLILSGGAEASSDEASGGDVAFYVSGSVGDRGHANRGTSVFGGDLVVSGALHTEQPISIVHNSTSTDALLITSTENGSDASPIITLKRNSSSPANADYLGQVKFKGENDNDEEIVYAKITGKIGDKADGAEDGIIEFTAKNAGSNTIVARVKNNGFAATSLKHLGDSSNKIDFNTGQVLILSGGSDDSFNEASGNDVAFYVSGSVGKRGTSERGTAVFGGDVVISGTLHGEDVHVGESIFHSGDTDTKIVFADDAIGITVGGEQLITVTEAGQDIVKIGDGGDVDFQVRTDGDDNTLYVQGSSDRVGIGTNSPESVLHIKESAPTLSIQRESNSNDSTVAFLGSGGSTGAIMHLSSSNDLVFKTHDGSSPHEIMRLGGHYGSDNRQIILLSGSAMAASAMQPKEAGDINFFVSGAVGKRGTSEKGTAVFGGDLVMSGTTHALGVVNAPAGLSGSITQLSDGTSYIKAGSNITITSASNGAITIASTGGGAAVSNVGWLSPANQVISTTGSLKIGTADENNPDINLGSDGSAVFNEQSNSVDFRIESNDLSHMVFVDGSANQVAIGAPSADITSNAKLVISSSTDASLLTLNVNTPNVARTNSIMSVISGSAYVFNLDKHGKAVFNPDFANQANPTVPTDVTFFVSGSSNVDDRHTASGGVTLFGGNIVTSGSIIPGADSSVDLGSATNRFRNVYTGDLHLRNDKGDWTIVEERDYLCVINNITGKKYKMDLTPLED